MSDDISIPRPTLSGNAPGRTSFSHSYRSRRTGMDVSTKRLIFAASAFGMLLVGGMTAWSLRADRPATGVPRIEADNRPMRVKPDNPGGMTAIGVGDQSTSTGSGDLAPAAEQPDPQALLAQRRTAPAPAITSVPALPPPPLAAASAPIQATPIAAPGSDLAMRPALAAPGGPLVQLAAVASETAAAAEWQRLGHKLPDLLGDRHPVVQRADQAGKPFWRLRTGGFTDVADATQFCKRVRTRGVGCSLANF